MRWDAVLTGALATELNTRLNNARARALLLDRTGRALVLYLREATLEVRFDGPQIHIALGDPTEPPDVARPLQARLRGIESVPDDRVLRFHLQRLRGRAEHPILVIELTGTRGNVILVGRESGRILSALFRREGSRVIAPSQVFLPLPPPKRPGTLKDPDPSLWEELPGDPDARRDHLGGLAWTSPLNLGALAAAPDPQELWLRLAATGRGGPAEDRPAGGVMGWGAGVFRGDEGAYAYPTPLSPGEWEPHPSLLEAMAATDGGDSGAPYLPAMVRTRLEKKLNGARKKLRALEREERGILDPQALRAQGDLLLARLHEVRRGAEEITLEGFDGVPVVLRLDPRLEPAENARKLYDAATRAHRATEEMPRRLDRARAAMQEAEERLDAALAGDVPSGGPAAGADGPRAGSTDEENLPYRTYRTFGGLEVRVGRGSKKNDDLTFRHSRPMDVWLHARDVPGAHVILRWDKEERPPARDLDEAAGLAALHSKARTSGTVPVDWTRRKHVRKPRKARPGSVIPSQVQTVFVEPDPELLVRLNPDGEKR